LHCVDEGQVSVYIYIYAHFLWQLQEKLQLQLQGRWQVRGCESAPTARGWRVEVEVDSGDVAAHGVVGRWGGGCVLCAVPFLPTFVQPMQGAS